ncbi:hypothetical protein PAMA_017397 [Pampus argenteus]
MEQVLIFLMMLAGATNAFFTPAETICNATLSRSLCSATLGESVYIQVMANTSSHMLFFKKLLPSGPIKVFSLKKEKVTIQEAFRNRSEFFVSNSTFKITSVETTDSGLYTLEVFDRNGVHVKTFNVTLDVQESNSSIMNTSWLALLILISVIVVVVVVMVLTVSWWCCCHKRKKKSKNNRGIITGSVK